MAEAQLKSKVHKAIQTQIQPAANAGFAAFKTALVALMASIRKVDASVKAEDDPDTLATYLRSLTVDENRMTEARLKLLDAVDMLDKATEDDDDFAADKEEVEALRVKLEKTIDASRQQLKAAKDCAARGKEQIKKTNAGEANFSKHWASLVATMEDNIRRGARCAKTMEAARTAAAKAMDAHDAAGLKRAKAAAPDVGFDDNSLRGTYATAAATAFLKTVDIASFSAATRAQVASDIDDLRKQDGVLQKLAVRVNTLAAEMKALELAPRDGRKAVALLQLPAAAVAKMQDALDQPDPAIEKSLAAVLKQFKSATSAKDALTQLRRAKVV